MTDGLNHRPAHGGYPAIDGDSDGMVAAMVKLSRALGNPQLVDAGPRQCVEAALIEMAAKLLGTSGKCRCIVAEDCTGACEPGSHRFEPAPNPAVPGTLICVKCSEACEPDAAPKSLPFDPGYVYVADTMPSGETMAQREEVCAAWHALPDELRKDPRLTRLYHALGGPRMEDPADADPAGVVAWPGRWRAGHRSTKGRNAMSQSFIKRPDNGPHSALSGLGVLASEQSTPAMTDADPPKPVDHTWFSQAALDVTAERRRQIEREGWTPEHDDEHGDGSLALAAACYAAPMATKGQSAPVDVSGGRGETAVWQHRRFVVPFLWPRSWDASWWKPKDRRRDLVRAGALILAEIERLDRAAGVDSVDGGQKR